MSSSAAGPGSPGGLPCPCRGETLSAYAYRGEPLWWCREKCERYGRGVSGLCWGVNHAAHCGYLYEEIMATICPVEGDTARTGSYALRTAERIAAMIRPKAGSPSETLNRKKR